jgi:hypothetical protein
MSPTGGPVPWPKGGDPLAFDAHSLEQSLRLTHGRALDDVLTPSPFAEQGGRFVLPRAPQLPWRTPWERLLEELSAQGRLDPNVLGTDVPFAEEIAAAVVLEGWSHARSQAGRWVNRLMRLVSDGIPVHSTHTIVAHLALAWSAHHDGRTNESLRAACVARFAAELPSAAGVGAASFVRAAKLFHPVSCPKGHAR